MAIGSSRSTIAALILQAVAAGPAAAQEAERVGDFSVEVGSDSITGEDRSFATLWPEGEVFGDVYTGMLFLSCGRDSTALAGGAMLPAYGSPGDTLAVIVHLGDAAPDTLALDGLDGTIWYLKEQDVASFIDGALRTDSLVIEMLDAPRTEDPARFSYALAGIDTVMSRLGCAAVPPHPGRLAGRNAIQGSAGGMVPMSAMEMPRARNAAVVARYLERNYPRELWDSRVYGQVTVRLRVTETGSVDSVTVIRSSVEAFNPVAVDAIRQLCFFPATAYGRPVQVWLEEPIIFVPPDRRPRAQRENPPPPSCPSRGAPSPGAPPG